GTSSARPIWTGATDHPVKPGVGRAQWQRSVAFHVSRSLAADAGHGFSGRLARLRRAPAKQRLSDRAGPGDRSPRIRFRRTRQRTVGRGAPAIRGDRRSESDAEVLLALVLAHARARRIGPRVAAVRPQSIRESRSGPTDKRGHASR